MIYVEPEEPEPAGVEEVLDPPEDVPPDGLAVDEVGAVLAVPFPLFSAVAGFVSPAVFVSALGLPSLPSADVGGFILSE